MEIKRDAYLQQLIERKDNGMIKVITGIRRCGKSFLLFTIFKRYLLENGVDTDHIIEIALDGIENEELKNVAGSLSLCENQIMDWLCLMQAELLSGIMCSLLRIADSIHRDIRLISRGGIGVWNMHIQLK